MGSECCKSRPDDSESSKSLPKKNQQLVKLKETGEQLTKDLDELERKVQSLKKIEVLKPESIVRWDKNDYATYIAFLGELEKQAAALEHSPAIQLLGNPKDGETAEQEEARIQALSQFVSDLRAFNQPGDLPDGEWLSVVKQIVARKTGLVGCKGQKEEVGKQLEQFEGVVKGVENKEGKDSGAGSPSTNERKSLTVSLSDLHSLHALQSKLRSKFTVLDTTLDGCLRVVQGGERVFQAISYLSRIALGMQATIDRHKKVGKETEVRAEDPTVESDELEIVVRQTVD